jgi:hypothetical protein
VCNKSDEELSELQQKSHIESRKLHLLIPIQNGRLMCFQNIDREGLKKYKYIELRNDHQETITAFDANEKVMQY